MRGSGWKAGKGMKLTPLDSEQARLMFIALVAGHIRLPFADLTTDELLALEAKYATAYATSAGNVYMLKQKNTNARYVYAARC